MMTIHSDAVSDKSDVSNTNLNCVSRVFTDDVMSVMNELMVKLADLERAHGYVLQACNEKAHALAYEKRLSAYNTKAQSIAQNATVECWRGITDIVCGAVNVAGAASGNSFAMSGATGFSKAGEGASKVGLAGQSEEAQKTNLLAEFQTTTAQETDKRLTDIENKIGEMRQKTREALNMLADINGRLTASVKFS